MATRFRALHLLDPQRNEYNTPALRDRVDRQPVVLIAWARRQQVFLAASGNPLEIRGIADLARPKLRIVDRQSGTGSSILPDTLLQRPKIPKQNLLFLDRPARNEIDVGAAVANGKADAGIAIEAVARQFGLGFIPLACESFDLAIHHRHFFDPPFQQLLDFTRQPQFCEKAEELSGYDVTQCGRVRFNTL